MASLNFGFTSSEKASQSLNSSLLFYSSMLNTPSTFLENFPPENNPRPSRDLGDNALYWLSNDGNPLTLTFPGVLGISSRFPRIGPYFNLMTSQPVCVYVFSFSLTHVICF
jgi:hypothetical protein